MISRVKLIVIFIFLLFLYASVGFVRSNPKDSAVDNFSFSQVLHLPIDASLPQSALQPIDMSITFDHPCWARNETSHSVRVMIDSGSDLIEIESQIYDLNFESECQLASCNLVFIIPENVQGDDCFILLYDDSETANIVYSDHLEVLDLHHYYEPISGQSMDFDYYQINQDDEVIYGILQKGILLGNGISHTVVKCKEHTETFEMFHTDQVATFYMSHHTAGSQHNNIGWTGTGWAEDVSTSVLIDGNLMVKVRITSISPEKTLKTDNVYTYYYCPSPTRRLYVDANHDVLKTIQVTGALERDGTYASLSTFKSRIAAIEKMNIGRILPMLHVYDEDETIKEFSIPSDPTSSKEEWILSTQDDCDLGKNAWVCLDDPDTGKAHGIIFGSNTGFIDGGEDGLQVKTAVKQHVKLPGLEADTGDVYITRNSFDRGGTHNTELASSLNISFQAEFVTFEKGGYQAVQDESELYQTLIPTHPSNINSVSNEGNKEKARHELTVFVHGAPSFPFGSLLSASLGRSFSFISVELFENLRLASSGSAGRIPIGSIPGFSDETSLVQKARQIIHSIEFKNLSFFKKITFPDLTSGSYIVKVFKENSLFGSRKEFIGVCVVDLNQDTSSHVYCTKEAEIQISSVDQDENTLSNVQAILMNDDNVISEGVTDENGTLFLHVPYYFSSSYRLNYIYQGVLLEEETIPLRMKNVVLPFKTTTVVQVHDLSVNIVDTLGLTPSVDLSPSILNENQINTWAFQPEKRDNGRFIFSDVLAENYVLQLRYKSFVLEEEIVLDDTIDLDVVFPAEFIVSFEVLDRCGLPIYTGDIEVTRDDEIKQTVISAEETKILIPPGEYYLRIPSSDRDLYHQVIDVYSDKTVVAVTDQDSVIHQLFVYLGLGLALFSFLYASLKKDASSGLKLLSLSLIIIGLFSPWWVLSGSENDISLSTENYVFPSTMITHTSTETFTFGEKGLMPMEITLIFDIIMLVLVLSGIGLISSLFLDHLRHRKRFFVFHSSIILILIVIVLYLVTIYQVTSLGVGSLIGSGSFDVSVPDSASAIALPCSWGPGIGLMLCCMAGVLLGLTRVIQHYTM